MNMNKPLQPMSMTTHPKCYNTMDSPEYSPIQTTRDLTPRMSTITKNGGTPTATTANQQNKK